MADSVAMRARRQRKAFCSVMQRDRIESRSEWLDRTADVLTLISVSIVRDNSNVQGFEVIFLCHPVSCLFVSLSPSVTLDDGSRAACMLQEGDPPKRRSSA